MGYRAPFSVAEATDAANEAAASKESRLAIRDFAKKQMAKADAALAKK